MISIKRIASHAALSAIALLVTANAPARAQYVCTTSPADITCTNTGTAGAEFNQVSIPAIATSRSSASRPV